MHLVLITASLLLVVPILKAERGRCYLNHLKNLAHVSIESETFTLSGDRLSIICEDGYSAEESMPICLNETWYPDNKTLCKESDCEIPRIFNGSLGEEKFGDWYWNKTRWERSLSLITLPTGSAVSSGRVLQLFCNNSHSFSPSGRQTLAVRCSKGRWSTDLHCLRADCSDPPPFTEHGRVRDTFNVTHGSVVKYDCENPYVLLKESVVQCSFGLWTGKPPRCEDSRCYLKDFKNLTHVSAKSEQVTQSGDRPNIICDNGYLSEINMPICRNGTWYPDRLPLCKENNCEIPRILRGSLREIQNGEFIWNWRLLRYERPKSYIKIPSGNAVSSDKVLWFFCDSPYSVHGSGARMKEIRCSKGKWSMDLQCLHDGERYIPSTAASVVEHASTTTSSSTSDWTSSTGTDTENPEVVVTLQSPTEICFCEYPIEEGNIIAHVDGKRLIYGDKVLNGSTVEFRCERVGYHLFRGPRNLTCIDCTPWHSSEFPNCTEPKSGDAVIFLNNNYNVLTNGSIEMHKGQSANFPCIAVDNTKYPKWIAPVAPGISVTKKNISREEYGELEYITYLHIENADYENEGTYECSNGGNHESSVIRVIIADADIRCPEFPENDGITVNYENERRASSNVSFSCSKGGQYLVGQPVLTCLRSGEWSGPPPKCSGGLSCKLPVKTPGSMLILSPEKEIFYFGETLQFSCPPGMELTSEIEVIMCLNNGWTGNTLPNCKGNDADIRCPEFPEIDGITVNYESGGRAGSNASFSCSKGGQELVGKSVLTCLRSGEWSGPPPKCSDVLSCKLPAKTPDSLLILNPEKEIFYFGDTLHFSCPPGMELTSEIDAIMCLRNGWTGKILPNCKDKGVLGCVLNMESSPHLRAQPLKDSYRFGEFVLLSCPPGKKMTDQVERIMCLGSTWSESLPNCEDWKRRN